MGIPDGSAIKNLPLMQEMQVQSLGWEDPLEKEMQPTPVLLPGKLHGQRSLAGYLPWGGKESAMTWQLSSNNMPFTLKKKKKIKLCIALPRNTKTDSKKEKFLCTK